MLNRRISFVFFIVAVLAMFPSMLPAGPIYVGSVTDPQGDTAGGPDIIMARIMVDDSFISFRMDFAAGTLDPATTMAGFSLDTDQNPATGGAWNGIGVDFIAHQGYLGDTGDAYLWQNGIGNIASTAVIFSTDRVEFSFARGLFGAEDGLLNYIAHVQIALSSNSSTQIRDYAPNLGAGPASTELVPEPSALLLVAAGLAVMDLGRRKRIR